MDPSAELDPVRTPIHWLEFHVLLRARTRMVAFFGVLCGGATRRRQFFRNMPHAPHAASPMWKAEIQFARRESVNLKTALSENLTGWANYAALLILRTARSSRLLTASRLAWSSR